MREKYIWVLILFGTFEGLGLRSDSWGGLGDTLFGWYGLVQLSIIGLMIVLPIFKKRTDYFYSKITMSLPIKLILFLGIFILFQTIFQASITGDMTLKEIFSNFIRIRYLFFYFLFVHLFNSKNGIQANFNIIIKISILSALIAIFIIVFNIRNLAFKMYITHQIGREFRVFMPTAMLISLGYFYMLVKYKFEKKNKYLVLSLFLFITILLQMHRTVIFGIVVVSIIAFIVLYGIKLKNIFSFIFSFFFILIGIYVVLSFIGVSVDGLAENFLSSKQEVLSSSGNFGVRVNLIVKSLSYVINNYLILGVGLNWEFVTNFKKYIDSGFIAGPTLDSSYGNIIIVYGLLGVAIYLFLFYRMFKTLFFCIKKSVKKEYTIISYTLLFTLIYLMITGISSDNFMLYNSTVVFLIIISLTYSLEYAIKKNI